ncbi:MAG: prepilin peptidase [Candidatus Nanosynbacter sp.]|nr:prepilin peptidase [Candidatus Nanosynbacter sp.]
MIVISIAIVCCVFGLVLGSFAGAQVWRLRARQLVTDKKAGESYDKAEYKKLSPLLKGKKQQDRSRCLSCGHQLGLRDLIPLISWLSTRGRCRYCGKRIGYFEPLMELSLAVAFMVSFLAWPWHLAGLQWVLFAVWCVSLVALIMLVAYDIKWRILPDFLTVSYGLVSLVFVVLRYFIVNDVKLYSLVIALIIMSGVYGVLYLISKGKWIGLGDVKLGVGLGLILASWQTAFVGLFLANLIGCVLVIPGLASKKLKANSEIAFGPLLALGSFISFFVGVRIMDWLVIASFF